jgi:hypothetical protein
MLLFFFLLTNLLQDQAVWNVDFLSVFPLVSVRDLNNLERKFLEVLNYNVGMKVEEEKLLFWFEQKFFFFFLPSGE